MPKVQKGRKALILRAQIVVMCEITKEKVWSSIPYDNNQTSEELVSMIHSWRDQQGGIL